MDERPDERLPGMTPVSDDEARGITPTRSRPTRDGSAGMAPPEIGVGALLDAGWTVFTKRFWLLLGIQLLLFGAAIVIVIFVVMAVMGSDMTRDLEGWEPEDGFDALPVAFLGVGLALTFAYVVLIFAVQGALTWAAVRQMQVGRCGFGEALSVGIQRTVPLAVTGFCAGVLVVLVAGIPIGIGLVLGGGLDPRQDDPPIGLLVGGLVALIPVAILATAWWIISAVVVVEGRWLSAIGRSWSLTKGHRWTLFFLIVVLQLLSAAVGFVPLVGPLLQIPAGAFTAIMPAVAYYALRHKKEGVTIHQLDQVFE